MKACAAHTFMSKSKCLILPDGSENMTYSRRPQQMTLMGHILQANRASYIFSFDYNPSNTRPAYTSDLAAQKEQNLLAFVFGTHWINQRFIFCVVSLEKFLSISYVKVELLTADKLRLHRKRILYLSRLAFKQGQASWSLFHWVTHSEHIFKAGQSTISLLLHLVDSCKRAQWGRVNILVSLFPFYCFRVRFWIGSIWPPLFTVKSSHSFFGSWLIMLGSLWRLGMLLLLLMHRFRSSSADHKCTVHYFPLASLQVECFHNYTSVTTGPLPPVLKEIAACSTLFRRFSNLLKADASLT